MIVATTVAAAHSVYDSCRDDGNEYGLTIYVAGGRLDKDLQQIDVKGWPRGLYLLRSDQSSIRFMIK
ncbi:MAG TPA: hypothetical protein VFS31_06070 [Chitinophagaceae bacterium]|nr:hypothetical protein [Chitinophagaceae bacterium]